MGNIGILRALVASAEQDDKLLSMLETIDPVAGAMIDLHLEHPAMNRADSPETPVRRTFEAIGDHGLRLAVAQFREPFGKV